MNGEMIKFIIHLSLFFLCLFSSFSSPIHAKSAKNKKGFDDLSLNPEDVHVDVPFNIENLVNTVPHLLKDNAHNNQDENENGSPPYFDIGDQTLFTKLRKGDPSKYLDSSTCIQTYHGYMDGVRMTHLIENIISETDIYNDILDYLTFNLIENNCQWVNQYWGQTLNQWRYAHRDMLQNTILFQLISNQDGLVKNAWIKNQNDAKSDREDAATELFYKKIDSKKGIRLYKRMNSAEIDEQIAEDAINRAAEEALSGMMESPGGDDGEGTENVHKKHGKIQILNSMEESLEDRSEPTPKQIKNAGKTSDTLIKMNRAQGAKKGGIIIDEMEIDLVLNGNEETLSGKNKNEMKEEIVPHKETVYEEIIDWFAYWLEASSNDMLLSDGLILWRTKVANLFLALKNELQTGQIHFASRRTDSNSVKPKKSKIHPDILKENGQLIDYLTNPSFNGNSHQNRRRRRRRLRRRLTSDQTDNIPYGLNLPKLAKMERYMNRKGRIHQNTGNGPVFESEEFLEDIMNQEDDQCPDVNPVNIFGTHWRAIAKHLTKYHEMDHGPKEDDPDGAKKDGIHDPSNNGNPGSVLDWIQLHVSAEVCLDICVRIGAGFSFDAVASKQAQILWTYGIGSKLLAKRDSSVDIDLLFFCDQNENRFGEFFTLGKINENNVHFKIITDVEYNVIGIGFGGMYGYEFQVSGETSFYYLYSGKMANHVEPYAETTSTALPLSTTENPRKEEEPPKQPVLSTTPAAHRAGNQHHPGAGFGQRAGEERDNSGNKERGGTSGYTQAEQEASYTGNGVVFGTLFVTSALFLPIGIL